MNARRPFVGKQQAPIDIPISCAYSLPVAHATGIRRKGDRETGMYPEMSFAEVREEMRAEALGDAINAKAQDMLDDVDCVADAIWTLCGLVDSNHSAESEDMAHAVAGLYMVASSTQIEATLVAALSAFVGKVRPLVIDKITEAAEREVMA